jgi:hypothetical protein
MRIEFPPDTPHPTTDRLDTDPSDEVDVDLSDDHELEAAASAHATVPEDLEYLGEYGSVKDYLRAQLEPEVSTGCAWILDYLDYQAVLAKFETSGARYFCEHGYVYRTVGVA